MKKFARILLTAVVVVLSCLTIFSTCAVGINQNASGGFSSVCDISRESKDWILENFREYETADELMNGMLRFALKEFTYKDMGYFLIQTANFDKFIGENDFHGVCFEFSVFAKTVALVWAEEKGVDMKAYICNVWYWKGGKRQGHSYNYFEYDGDTVYLDLTADNSHFKKGELQYVYGAVKTHLTKEEYNKTLYEKSYAYYI